MRRCFILGQKETAMRIAGEPVRMVAGRKGVRMGGLGENTILQMRNK